VLNRESLDILIHPLTDDMVDDRLCCGSELGAGSLGAPQRV
jgi:aromatic ring-cleaving dioxygenase